MQKRLSTLEATNEENVELLKQRFDELEDFAR